MSTFISAVLGAGVTFWLLVTPYYQGYVEIKTEAVQHGYGKWCVDRSFAWQHEECE